MHLALLLDLLALTGGTVHAVPGEEPVVADVLIRDGRIEKVGPDLELAPGTVRRDLTGLHLVPGLIDGFVHFDPAHDALYVSVGVTVVRDFGGVGRMMNEIQRQPDRRNRVPGPTLYTALTVLDGDPPASPEAAVLRDPAAAEALLPILIDEHAVDFLSVQPGLSEDVWRRVLELASAAQVPVWGAVPRGVSLEAALAAGQRGILYLDPFLPEGVEWRIVRPAALAPRIEAFAASDSVLVPLLQAQHLQLADQASLPEQLALLALLDPHYAAWWEGELQSRRVAMADEELREVGRRVGEKQIELVASLLEAGGRLVPGSGSPHPWLFPGQALHQELARLVDAGLEPVEALRLATAGAADALGIAKEHGRLAPGLVADVVVMGGDPRESLESLLDPELVCVRGRLLERRDREDMLETLARAHAKTRERLTAPVPVQPPPMPEGDPVLSGVVESRTATGRVSAESFEVVRLLDGRVALGGRTVYPDQPGREMLVNLITRDGELEDFTIALRQEGAERGRELICRGTWTASTFRIERRLDGMFLDTKSVARRIWLADTSSVTSLLMLGQRELSDSFAVVTFHEMLEPELANWSVELDGEGSHQVRTHIGRMAFRMTPEGAPERCVVAVGKTRLLTELRELDALGGAGYPLPPAKRRAQEAAAPAEGEAVLPEADAAEADAAEGGGPGASEETAGPAPEPAPERSGGGEHGAVDPKAPGPDGQGQGG